MKKLVLLFVIISIGHFVNAQVKDFDSIPQKPIRPTKSIPRFVDSIKLVKDIQTLKTLKDVYIKLKADTADGVFQYSFNIDKKGNVILGKPEEFENLRSINEFVESEFLNYKWEPGYRLGCKKCFVKTHGVLIFHFDTVNKNILCIIEINNEKSYKIFNEKVIMD